MRNCKVTAVLVNEMAGVPPQLDALLIDAVAKHNPSAGPHERYNSAPHPDTLPPIPLWKDKINGQWVYHVSAPIVPTHASDRHEHVNQHFPREQAGLMQASEQGVIATTNGAQKSYRLPVRMRLFDRVVWFACLGPSQNQRRSTLRKLLNSVTHIGQDRSRGHGRVSQWIVEECEHDWSWFAPSERGPVLMRNLPLGDDIPQGLIGARQDFDAVLPPYWHPQRKCEMVRPC